MRYLTTGGRYLASDDVTRLGQGCVCDFSTIAQTREAARKFAWKRYKVDKVRIKSNRGTINVIKLIMGDISA
ncbi:hypothetical protein RC83_03995 [Pectobacterium brasiliense]|nr:hypothetical protein RC83_03995 [Pectobacterium brasiliense]